MRVVFAGIELGCEGDGITDKIRKSEVQVAPDVEVVKLIRTAPIYRDRGTRTYTLSVSIPYFYDDYETARAEADTKALLFKSLGVGDLEITDVRPGGGGTVWQMANCTIKPKGPDGDGVIGCFFEYTFVFEGGSCEVKRI